MIHVLYNCTAVELLSNINMQKAGEHVAGFCGCDSCVISEQFGYTKKEKFYCSQSNTFGFTIGPLKEAASLKDCRFLYSVGETPVFSFLGKPEK